MNIHKFRPTDYLSEFIEEIVYFKNLTTPHRVEKVVPDLSSYLVVELDGRQRTVFDNDSLKPKYNLTGTWISGQHTEYLTIDSLPNSELLAIRFKAVGAYPFIHKSQQLLFNKVVQATKIFGDDANALRDGLLKESGYKKKFQFCKAWLHNRFDPSKLPPSILKKSLSRICESATFGGSRINHLVKELGISRKHLTALYETYIGLSPRKYLRIFRFREILEEMSTSPKLSWAQLGLSCGYYDQSHFNREFKKFCGINPAEYLKHYGENEEKNFLPLKI